MSKQLLTLHASFYERCYILTGGNYFRLTYCLSYISGKSAIVRNSSSIPFISRSLLSASAIYSLFFTPYIEFDYAGKIRSHCKNIFQHPFLQHNSLYGKVFTSILTVILSYSSSSFLLSSLISTRLTILLGEQQPNTESQVRNWIASRICVCMRAFNFSFAYNFIY